MSIEIISEISHSSIATINAWERKNIRSEKERQSVVYIYGAVAMNGGIGRSQREKEICFRETKRQKAETGEIFANLVGIISDLSLASDSFNSS